MNTKLLGIVLVLFLMSATALSLIPNASAETDLENLTQQISETSMSPFCPGRTISSCPSPQARELRAQIHAWLESGASEDQVRERLFAAYGEDVRGAPQSEGFGVLGWAIPPVFVLVSGVFMLLMLRRMRKNSSSQGLHGDPDPEIEEKVSQALKARL